MKKMYLGILLGAIIGILDVIPMILQGLTWDANLSAFSHWVVVGFLVATVKLKITGIKKGLLIAIVTFIPLAFLIWWNDQSSVVPIVISTVIFGSLLGYSIDRYGK